VVERGVVIRKESWLVFDVVLKCSCGNGNIVVQTVIRKIKVRGLDRVSSIS
jgi:hypothetical protein